MVYLKQSCRVIACDVQGEEAESEGRSRGSTVGTVFIKYLSCFEFLQQ